MRNLRTLNLRTVWPGLAAAAMLGLIGIFNAIMPAPAQGTNPPAYNFNHIAAIATTAVKSGAGTLHTICINTPAATATASVYGSTTAGQATIAVITSFASAPGCFTYDVGFASGLTVVTGTATPDITVSYR